MNILGWVLAVLMYFLCGQIFSFCYIINYKPADRTAMLGLMGLFWPVLLLADLVVQIGAGFGVVSRTLMSKLDQ